MYDEKSSKKFTRNVFEIYTIFFHNLLSKLFHKKKKHRT